MAIMGHAVLGDAVSGGFKGEAKVGSYLTASAFGLMRSGTAFLFASWLEPAWMIESIDDAPIGAIAWIFATAVTGCRVLRVLEGDFG